ncbi:MAG: phosphoglycerate mutase, partial [bacterium]
SFSDKWKISGSVITAVDLIKGIGIAAGLKPIEVPGATGYLDTDFQGKARYALKALEKDDFVMIHVEAPDEAGHMGKLELKVKAIEDFDRLVVGEILRHIGELGEVRMLVCPDHATPLSLRTHTRDTVPFVLYSSNNKSPVRSQGYHERWEQAPLVIQEGHLLINRLFV